MTATTTWRIVRISPFRTARIAAILWLLGALPYAFFAQIPRWIPFEYAGWVMLVLPVLYGVAGFILTLLGAACYNLLAPRVGGIVYTVREAA